MMDESTTLYPREIAVLRAVQGSFRQLRESRRPVDGLIQQIAARLDEVGDRMPGYWRADHGRRVRKWLTSPHGLPTYPRIRKPNAVGMAAVHGASPGHASSHVAAAAPPPPSPGFIPQTTPPRSALGSAAATAPASASTAHAYPGAAGTGAQPPPPAAGVGSGSPPRYASRSGGGYSDAGGGGAPVGFNKRRGTSPQPAGAPPSVAVAAARPAHAKTTPPSSALLPSTQHQNIPRDTSIAAAKGPQRQGMRQGVGTPAEGAAVDDGYPPRGSGPRAGGAGVSPNRMLFSDPTAKTAARQKTSQGERMPLPPPPPPTGAFPLSAPDIYPASLDVDPLTQLPAVPALDGGVEALRFDRDIAGALPSYPDAQQQQQQPLPQHVSPPRADVPGSPLGSPSSAVAASWQLYDEALRRFTAACDESDLLLKYPATAGGQTHARGLSPPTPQRDASSTDLLGSFARGTSPHRIPTMSPPVPSASAAGSVARLSPPIPPKPSPPPALPAVPLPTPAVAPPTNILKIVEEARAVMAQASNVLKSTPPPYYDGKVDPLQL